MLCILVSFSICSSPDFRTARTDLLGSYLIAPWKRSPSKKEVNIFFFEYFFFSIDYVLGSPIGPKGKSLRRIGSDAKNNKTFSTGLDFVPRVYTALTFISDNRSSGGGGREGEKGREFLPEGVVFGITDCVGGKYLGISSLSRR